MAPLLLKICDLMHADGSCAAVVMMFSPEAGEVLRSKQISVFLASCVLLPTTTGLVYYTSSRRCL